MNTNRNTAWQRFSIWLLKRNALGTLLVWSYITTGVMFLAMYEMVQHNIGENLSIATTMLLMILSMLLMVFVYIPKWEEHHEAESIQDCGEAG